MIKLGINADPRPDPEKQSRIEVSLLDGAGLLESRYLCASAAAKNRVKAL